MPLTRIRKKLSQLKTSEFSKNVVTILSGAVAGQAIAAAAMPVLSRLYTPYHFGVLTAFTALLQPLLVASSWKLEMAIPAQKDDLRAKATTLAAFTALVITGTGATLIGVLAYVLQGPTTFRLEGSVLILVPVAAMLGGLYNVLNFVSIRQKKYSVMAKTRAIQTIWGTAVQCFAGIIRPHELGLVLGSVVTMAAGSRKLWQSSWKTLKGHLRFKFHDFKQVTQENWRLVTFTAPAAFVNNLGLQTPMLLAVLLFLPTDAGFLGFAARIVSVPVYLVVKSFSQVFYGESARLILESPEKMLSFFNSTVLKLLGIGIVFVIGGFILGKWLYVYIFGSQWKMGGAMTLALLPLSFGQILVSPVSQVLMLTKQQELQFAWDLSRLFLVAGVFAYSFNSGHDLVITIRNVSLASAGWYLLLLFLSYRALHRLKLKTSRGR